MATNDKIYLDTSALESIASSLKVKAATILDEYNSNCYAALTEGNDCLEISGLNTNTLFEKLNTIYTSISQQCNELADFLTNTVIPNYNDTSIVVTESFDSNLGEKLANLLGITFQTTATGAAAVGVAVTAGVSEAISSVTNTGNQGGSTYVSTGTDTRSAESISLEENEIPTDSTVEDSTGTDLNVSAGNVKPKNNVKTNSYTITDADGNYLKDSNGKTLSFDSYEEAQDSLLDYNNSSTKQGTYSIQENSNLISTIRKEDNGGSIYATVEDSSGTEVLSVDIPANGDKIYEQVTTTANPNSTNSPWDKNIETTTKVTTASDPNLSYSVNTKEKATGIVFASSTISNENVTVDNTQLENVSVSGKSNGNKYSASGSSDSSAYWSSVKDSTAATVTSVKTAATASTPKVSNNSASNSSSSGSTKSAANQVYKTCFIAGTKVLTDKGLINIEELKPNDNVLSYNEETKTFEYNKILQHIVHEETQEKLYNIQIENDNINVTESHRFYVINDDIGNWLRTYELKVGDKLLKSNGCLATINSISNKECNEQVYNLEVENNHNYFVGNGYLVHNRKVE